MNFFLSPLPSTCGHAYGIHLVEDPLSRTVHGLQPVPEKMRLEMLVEMQIEILNGGEIVVS